MDFSIRSWLEFLHVRKWSWKIHRNIQMNRVHFDNMRVDIVQQNQTLSVHQTGCCLYFGGIISSWMPYWLISINWPYWIKLWCIKPIFLPNVVHNFLRIVAQLLLMFQLIWLLYKNHFSLSSHYS